MKKQVIWFFLLIISVSLGACSKQADFGADSGPGGANGFRRPDFGQPQEAADFRGLVKAIAGNEVVILKIERPLGDFGRASSSRESEAGSANQNQGKAFGASGAGGGRMPGIGGSFRPGGGREANTEQQAEMLERIKQMAAGEETVLIPVGIQMLKPDASSGKPAMVEATLADIKADAMLQIWLDPNVADRKVAKFVMIMN